MLESKYESIEVLTGNGSRMNWNGVVGWNLPKDIVTVWLKPMGLKTQLRLFPRHNKILSFFSK